MKTIKLFLTAGLLALVTSASAQFANAGDTESTAVSGPRKKLVKDTRNYSRIDVSYTPIKLVQDVSGADDVKLSGFLLGYTYGLNIVKDIPLFLEFGMNGAYAATTLDYEELGLSEDLLEQKITVAALNIPVSVGYKLSFSEKVSLTPFVGVNFRGMLLGKGKYSITDQSILDQLQSSGYSEADFWQEMETDYGVKQEQDMFDKDDMGSKDATWKRIQVGWQIGVGLNFKHLHVGLAYGKDFSELYKKCKVSFTTISLGYNF